MRALAKTLVVAMLAMLLAAALAAQTNPAQSPGATANAPRNLLVNPGFEEGREPGSYRTESVGSTDIPGWTVTLGTVDVCGPLCGCVEGRRCIDLDGTTAGALAQTFPTQAGKKYRLSFAEGANFYAGPTVKKFYVKVAGQLAIFSYDTRTTKGWHTETWEFSANSDETSLEFASLDPEESGAGVLLDNVSVVEVPAITPVFKLLDPAGAESGKPVTYKADSLRLRGLVSHPAGVTSVSLNGANLPVETVNPQTAAFDASNQPLQPGRNEFVLLAKASDQGEAKFVLVVLRPGLRVTAPAKGQTAEAAVTLRGVLLGVAVVARAEIAGRPAVLQPQPDGSTQFEVGEVSLAVGNNALEVVVTGAQGEREVFPLTLVRVALAPAPLSVQEVEEALRSGIPPQRVATMATQYGVNFALTDEVERRLREAGADDALLFSIAKAKK